MPELPLDAGVFDAASPGGHPASWVATGRWGGVSDAPFSALNLAEHVGDAWPCVQENRARCAHAAGLDSDRLAVVGAVHGGQVGVVDAGGQVPGVDALVTGEPGLALLALAADCVPVALADPDAGVIGVLHCGWRGLGAGIVANTVHAMRALGAREVSAVLGPSICVDCYPVPAQRVIEVRGSVTSAVAMVACPSDRDHLDVAAGVQAQLAALDIASRRIPGCTAEDPRLFSFRRDGRTGRQGMMVWR